MLVVRATVVFLVLLMVSLLVLLLVLVQLLVLVCQGWRSKGSGWWSWWPPWGGRWGRWLGCRRCLRWRCLVAVLVAGARLAGLVVLMVPSSHV